MVGTVLSQKPRRLQRFRNESSFARSDAEQRPDHAGRQYVILARMVARNTSWSDSVEMPWPRRTLITYSKLLHDVSKLFTWSVTLSRSLSVMPRTLAQLTHSVFGHGGGGWDDWPHFSRMKMSSFDFVWFSLRLFRDAQASTWEKTPMLSIASWVLPKLGKMRTQNWTTKVLYGKTKSSYHVVKIVSLT